MSGCARIPVTPQGTQNASASPVAPCACCQKLDCSVKLGDKKTLIPLGLVLYANGKINLGPNPQKEWNQDISPTSKSMIAQPGINDDPELERVSFNIKIDCECNQKKNGDKILDSAEIEIKDSSGATIYNENLSSSKAPNYLAKGTHIWKWDGYDSSGILDTGKLKQGKLKIVLKTTCEGAVREWEKEVACESPNSDWAWVDVKVDRGSKKIEMLWRLDIDSQNDGTVSSDMVALALSSINKHWSRTITRYLPADEDYAVAATAVNKVTPKMYRNFDLYVDHTGDKASDSFTGSIYYNAKIKPQPLSDDNFIYTAAHEIGHIVLDRAYNNNIGGMDVSWQHKGTSMSPISFDAFLKREQSLLPDSPTYMGGDADVMWYYKNNVSLVMVKAAKEDVRGAVWLAQLEFE